MAGTMNGKTVLITGASAGIGKAAARALAGMGASVFMMSRDRSRGEAARSEIAAATGNPRIEFLACDLSRPAEVRAAADAFLAGHDRLDVLINNAAIIPYRRTKTADGLETQFAVNHLAYFLLTDRLLDRLRASAPSRIVLLSSGLHRRADINFDDLQSEKSYRGMKVYGRTKLMNLLFMLELDRRLAGTGVTVNALSPGFTATDLGRSAPPLSRLVFKTFGKPPEKGADTVVFLASSPDVEGVSGRYFNNRRIEDVSAAARDAASAGRLWEISARLGGLDPAGERPR
jgi:NAD(P)-dependent dehydrogenase (short-subunit alcohol dehydrogenase family)